MKILLLNFIDSGAGGPIAARRLSSAMAKNGINAFLGVVHKTTKDKHILLFPKNLKKIKQTKGILHKTTNTGGHDTNEHSLLSLDAINNSDFDVVHLHCMGANTLSVEDIGKITKPIVWTMHDSWPFCGAEQHPNILENDTRFIEGYTKENFPKTSQGVDICRLTWKRKKKAWKNAKFNFISPSNYEAQCLNKSALFKKQIATVIPNIIPNTFKPQKVVEFKKALDIPLNRKIIGFGAAYLIDGKKNIKGTYYLIKALEKIKDKKNYFAIIFGHSSSDFLDKLPIKYFAPGNINNENLLSIFYNILDVFVCPSIIENLPNVCVEAMFCGVPVAAFKTGGIPDIVVHKKTGYLAKPFVVSDLARGIEFCLANKKELSKNSLARAKSNYFSEKRIVEEHLKVYKEALYAPRIANN